MDPNQCDKNASCTNNNGSYDCTCMQGFTGDGKTCQGKPFVSKRLSRHVSIFAPVSTLHRTTIDINIIFYLTLDIDECSADPNPCDQNAACTNSDGSYNCTCKQGFIGNGATCNGK